MSDRGIPSENGAVSTRPARLRTVGRLAICTSIATLVLAALPSLAAAFTPLVVGTSATPTSNGATLNATIYPYGLKTTYHFEYGASTSYGTSTPDGDAGSAAYPATFQVHETITGLVPNMAYHFKIVASNSDGSATGPETGDKTFTTLATPPSVTINPVSPTVEGFELSGTVDPHGAHATYHFEYSTTSTTTGPNTKIPVSDGEAGSGTTAATVSQEVKNSVLLPNTTYHFRLVAQNSGGSAPSAEQTFKTPPSAPAAPSAVVSPPIKIGLGEYKLEGAINPNSLATHYHFEFGTLTSYGTNIPELSDAEIPAGESAVPVAQTVTGLQPNTTYHYRIVAGNSEGPGISSDQSFKTAPEPPVVVATPFTETAGGFNLNGTINPNGGETKYHFEFGSTEAYGSNIPATEVGAGEGTSPVAVSQLVTGLPPNFPYHYLLVATNAGGTTKSGDQEFTTPPAAILPESPVQLLPMSSPPPPSLPLTNQFTVKPAIAKGTAATLQVNVPGPGTISASGKQLKMVTAGSSGAGLVTLKLKLTGAGLKALKKAKGHKLTVKVKIVFQPTGGSPGTTNRTVTFKM